MAIGKKRKEIQIVSYDKRWLEIYEDEAESIKKALSNNEISIHHIGSTAIEGLSAKPKIDILAVVKDFSYIDIDSLEQLGFDYRGEVIPSGRYLSKKNPGVHLHLFEVGNPLIDRYVVFRDWLRIHKEDRNAYQLLKQRLAEHHTDGMEYANDKTCFIKKILEKAKKIKNG